MMPFVQSTGCQLFLGGLLALACGSTAAADGPAFDLRPQWDTNAPLINPHKGWYHHYPDNHIEKYKIAQDKDLLEFPGMDHVYLRLSWAYLEPMEGQFDWPVIDRIIEKWTAHGLGIAFRISCKETGTDRVEQQFATPKWVMQAGAKGVYYRMGKEVGPDGPWEPDFGDPIFLEKLEHFLAAFASRYDGKPWLRYVDVGSIGDWGEGHTWAGSRKECGFAVRQRHLDLHLKYFKKSQLVLSDDYVYALTNPKERQAECDYAVANRISFRDDSILVNSYLQGRSDHFTVRSPEFFAAAYLQMPTVFELEHYGTVKKQGNWEARPDSSAAKYGKGKKGPEYFRGAMGLLHATYIGYHGYAHEWLADNPELTKELLNRCGYWFFPHRLRFSGALRAGARPVMEMNWENRGVAPAYRPYELHVRLEGPQVFEQVVDSGNQHWLPKAAEPFVEKYPLNLPATLKPGAYTVKFKLHSREASRDVFVALRPGLLDQANYYTAGTVTVGP
ncbi:MAG: DUF4832 domain-containing protein [Verrucomicrobiota bacterium]